MADNPRIHIEGPPDFLRAVMDTVTTAREQNDGIYMGIVTKNHGGGKYGKLDVVHLDIRDGVTRDEAGTIVSLALDRIASEHGLEDERQSTSLTYEGEDGRDHTL